MISMGTSNIQGQAAGAYSVRIAMLYGDATAGANSVSVVYAVDTANIHG